MDGPGSCDWDFWVNDASDCGSESIFIAKSGTDVKCDDSATGYSLTGDRYIKVHRNNGDGAGNINVKLVECLANNAIDSACPSAKPYCNNNRCVDCFVRTDCKGTDGTYNTYCPKNPAESRSHIIPSCTANSCICEAACVTNAGCAATDFCCTGDPQGPGISPGTCNSKGTIMPGGWLCT